MANHRKHAAYLYLICTVPLLGTVHALEAPQPAGAPAQAMEETQDIDINAERQIALDIVSVLLQISDMTPENTILRMQPPQDTFAANLGHFLNMSGYQVVLDEKTADAMAIEYFILDNSTPEDTIKTYQVDIGPLKLRRDYVITNNMALPLTAMYLQGADSSDIELNDDIFSMASAEEVDRQESSAPSSDQRPATLSVSTTDSKQHYRTGETIALSLSINYESTVFCYYKDGHGQILKIFPNRFNANNRLSANQSVVIPSSDNWTISATREGATDDFLCVATDPENDHLVSRLASEPDFEPMAARTLEAIREKISTDPNAPVIYSSLSLQVN